MSPYLKYIVVYSVLFVFFGCKTPVLTSKIPQSSEIRFLDAYVYPNSQKFSGTLIGGLSGISYAYNSYYLVADDAKNPRIYIADIKIHNQKIDTVIFNNVIELKKRNHPFYKRSGLDLESIDVTNHKMVITSEGDIKHGINPALFKADLSGNFIKAFTLPSRFLVNSSNKPRHNATLEGLSASYDAKGFWSAFELPLQGDGEEPAFEKANYPVRFTYFDAVTQQPTKEFVYELASLPRPSKGRHNINGLTDILEYKKHHFFVIERAYQSGYTNQKNVVRIYKAIIEPDATDVLNIESLKGYPYKPMRKELVFDFNTHAPQLANQNIDNIEGITLGPQLPNGNLSLILVSDDNFQKFGHQDNQFILLEIVEHD